MSRVWRFCAGIDELITVGHSGVFELVTLGRCGGGFRWKRLERTLCATADFSVPSRWQDAAHTFEREPISFARPAVRAWSDTFDT